MHLSRILDQIKRHPSPTEALTKLGKAMINMKIICSHLILTLDVELEFLD